MKGDRLFSDFSMTSQQPTIKGIFINSHIKAVEKKRGKEGVQDLERRYGKPMKFRNSEDVPVMEEVKIIECALEVISDTPIPPEDLAFQAGRLHFTNFTTTPLARIVFTLFRKDFKLTMLRAQHIAGHVFRGVNFATEDLGTNAIRIVMDNNNYPLDHFRGLFYEWVHFAGLKGTVEATEVKPGRFEYTIRWS